jgi:hypothetical protein
MTIENPAPLPPAQRLFKRVAARLRHTDWRIWSVLIAVLVSVAATVVVYLFKRGLDPATHFGAVFASWVGGVALFVVAGAVVAIVSLARPEEESFDARARILFRRQTGKHIDYIIGRIGRILEQYAESQIIKIRFEKYHADDRKFYIIITNETILRGYIDDIISHYESPMEYEEVSPPPANGAPNAVRFIRVQGVPIVGNVEFADRIKHVIETAVPANDSVKIEFEIGFWVRAEDEANSQTCVRYTQLFRLLTENTTGTTVRLRMKKFGDDRPIEVIVNPGDPPRPILELRDLPPDAQVVEFYLLAS